jgi:hypothetical protein
MMMIDKILAGVFILICVVVFGAAMSAPAHEGWKGFKTALIGLTVLSGICIGIGLVMALFFHAVDILMA